MGAPLSVSATVLSGCERYLTSDDFATQVLADGPVGYWRLGEPAGSLTAADASGNNNPGTCTGGITFGQPGLHGGDTAALFDGATGRISVTNSESVNPARITMEAKVRWDGATGFQQRILEKESFAGTTQDLLAGPQNGPESPRLSPAREVP